MKLTVIILTHNEQQHLSRCIESVMEVANEIYVVDSFSTDRTLDIAQEYNVRILQNVWVNHSIQFNWALTQINQDADWVLRIDADEVLSSQLISDINICLPSVGPEISGVYIGRRIKFMGRSILHGGIFPLLVLRLFRLGKGKCENRWMDEHILVLGPTINFKSELVDDNLKSLTWWTEKHNKYASLEAVELLNLKYRFMQNDSMAKLRGGSQATKKRWFKEVVYARLPIGLRALSYFFYRYFIRLGFLDGGTGTVFHVLQGFWYRYLVDIKITEVEEFMKKNKSDVKIAIYRVLGIKL